jgi:hypothetical protein
VGRREHYKRPPGGAFGASQRGFGKPTPKPGQLSETSVRRRIGELQALGIEKGMMGKIITGKAFTEPEKELLDLLARRAKQKPADLVREIQRREMLKNKKLLNFADLQEGARGFVSKMVLAYLRKYPFGIRGNQQEMQDRFVRENADQDLARLQSAVDANPNSWLAMDLFKHLFRTAFDINFKEEWVG